MSISYGEDKYTWSFNNNYTAGKKEFNLAVSKDFFSLYNNLINDRSKHIKFSDFIYFDIQDQVDEQLKTRNIVFSESIDFTNLMIKNSNISQDKVHFSKGLFPYYENINLLLESSTYEDFVGVLNNPNTEGYIFDNSVPSREVILQSKVISAGINDNNIQFSLRFPYYQALFEYNVENINTDFNFNQEFKVFPKTPDTDKLNFALDTVFAKDTLNWEWSPGEELKVSSNIEFGKTPDTITLMNYQYAYMFIEDRKLNL